MGSSEGAVDHCSDKRIGNDEFHGPHNALRFSRGPSSNGSRHQDAS